MKQSGPELSPSSVTYYVDEAGDGVLFGPMGRDRLADADAPRFFMLGMVQCASDEQVGQQLADLRAALQKNPLYATIFTLKPEAKKTARAFHAKDDHAEIRSKVFELLTTLDFKFYAVIKDMRAVRDYVAGRNRMDSTYRYHPNELYDLTVRMLFKQRLHKLDHHRVVFARRGHSDRTEALTRELEQTRTQFLIERGLASAATLEIMPAYPWEQPGVQVADYCLWALQRCYETHEARFLNAIWSKVSLIHDVDDPNGAAGYGTYLSRKGSPPNPEQIKNRWI
jgi:hypothetical protein